MRVPSDQVTAQAAELSQALQARPRLQVHEGLDMPVIEAPREELAGLMRELRDAQRFDHCAFVTAVDRLPDQPRFEVVYALYSIARNRWLRVKTRCGEDDPRVPSVTGIWPGADWHERECYDMFGVVFDGHPDLRRILMPEEFPHHPLRKDFPRDGIEPDRLYRQWEAARRAPPGGA
ncbi:MAG: NADH-quinone oxidoreductase subunit C [Planctomycetota bacterium]|nr:MAG: NADH-quinone oxidoreductase subunit C [Planctomycetota bacterium]